MENNKSDTLEQRRKAQKDFLELKKMQSGEIIPQQKQDDNYSKNLTTAAKIKNFWDYNKWFMLGGALIALVIAFCIAKCAATPDYDLRVVAYTSEILGDGDCLAIGEYLKPLCEDINADGEINVQVINCSYSETTSTNEHIYSNQTKIQGIISAQPDILLYITDQKTHSALSEIGSDVKLFSGEHSSLPDDFYSTCETPDDISIPKNLTIGIRTIKGTSIENEKNIDVYLNQAQNILNKLEKKQTD